MMERLIEILPVFVEFIPEKIEPGRIYISERFKTSSHLCACGCGELTVMPFGKGGWQFTKEAEGKVTFQPSIGNWKFKCRSHYYITRNKINFV